MARKKSVKTAESRSAALLLLAHVPWFRRSHLEVLKSEFGEPEELVEAPPGKIEKCELIGEAMRAELAAALRNFEPDKVRQSLENSGTAAVTLADEKYPKRLAEIYNPPLALFCKGDVSLLDRLSIAIVGSRKASNYGLAQAKKISADLADLGMVIVSGLALGIDAAGHAGALGVRGKTVAVLGCGTGVIYPPEHHDLFARIAREGCVASEYPPDTEPKAPHFPERNRIISGLSHGVFVAEAPMKSGALITARLALEQGREVFALPGLVTSPAGRGCNNLIKSGQAALVESAEDILTALKIDKRSLLYGIAEPSDDSGQAALVFGEDNFETESDALDKSKDKTLRVEVIDKSGYTSGSLAKAELDLLEKISYEGTHINDLARATNLSIAELSARLTMLEIKGALTTTSGGFYQRL